MKITYGIMLVIMASVATATTTAGFYASSQNPQRPVQKSESGTDVERGKYLVEEVAKCPECHTPRDENHELDRQRWLQGAPIWIQPVFRMDNWAESAPALAGLPGYSDDDIYRVLEKGEGVSGLPIQPPMHIYHMSHGDAAAIIAYLRSLPSAPSGQ